MRTIEVVRFFWQLSWTFDLVSCQSIFVKQKFPCERYWRRAAQQLLWVWVHAASGVRRCKHITPALRQLHWLPVRTRVDFKLSTLVYRSSAGAALVSVYGCTLVTTAGRRPLRSADNQTCVVIGQEIT